MFTKPHSQRGRYEFSDERKRPFLQSSTCPSLDEVEGGRISYTLPSTPNAQGSTAVLVCEGGSVPFGSLSTVCISGTWTNQLGSSTHDIVLSIIDSY